jgi:AraC-like DNA-binding protein
MVYYISCTVLLIVIFAIILFMYGSGRRIDDDNFQLRRRSFIAFYILLAVHVCSSYDIISAQGTEVLATFPICTLCLAFATFVMLSSAYFGLKHHQSISLWLILVQFPAIMLVIHIATRMAGRYVRVHSVDDIFYNRSEAMSIIFGGRLIFLVAVVLFFLLMVCMLVEAYRYYLRQQSLHFRESLHRKSLRRDEIVNILIYAALIIVMMVTYMIPNPWPHIFINLLMTCMIVRTLYVYNKFKHYSQTELKKEITYANIAKRISQLIGQERNNPIYQSNSNLDDVADALGVDRQDFSSYLYEELDTSFSGWVSERKIEHIASELVRTNRRIGELSSVCGYANSASLSRAFKAKYGTSPSEYREAHKVQ